MEPFQEWLNSLAAEETVKAYRRGCLTFLNHTGFEPGKALEARAQDLNDGDRIQASRFERLLRGCLADLEKKSVGRAMQQHVYNGTKSFFGYYDLDLRMKRRDFPTRIPVRENRAATKAEIRRMLSVCDEFERALVLTAKDSGLAVGDLARIRIENLGMKSLAKSLSWREILEDSRVPIPVIDKRKKTKQPYHTFLGPEAVEALRVYFHSREKGTEHLYRRGGVPPEELSEHSFVFRLKRKFKPFPAGQLSHVVSDIVKKAPKVQGVTAHSLRRYFQTSLENPELAINHLWISRMMGHKVSFQAPGHYSDPLTVNPDAYREAYRRAIPYLQVNPSAVDARQYADLKTQIEEEQKRTERLEAMVDVLLRHQEDSRRVLEELKKLRS